MIPIKVLKVCSAFYASVINYFIQIKVFFILSLDDREGYTLVFIHIHKCPLQASELAPHLPAGIKRRLVLYREFLWQIEGNPKKTIDFRVLSRLSPC